MDPTIEKTCLEEISTLVLDSTEKVTLKTISNNWSIPNNEARDVLTKWLDQNKKSSKNLSKEFLITGINSKGIFSISVVSEEKKNVLEKKWKKFTSWIYSVEQSKNSRKLDLPDFEPIKVKRILINSNKRDIHVPEIPSAVKAEPAEIKKSEPTKPKTPFSVMKPVEVKKEPVKPKSPGKSPEVKVEKSEKISPQESKPAAKAAPGKKGQTKNQKPAQKGISSFFSNKPSTSKTTENPPKVEVAKAEKRSASPEKAPVPSKESPAKPEPKKKQTKPASKKIKLKEQSNKRSRIRVMEDSSDEEAEEQNDPDEPETKFIKFDREFTPERNSSPEKSRKSPESKKKVEAEPETGKVKRKAKRYVKKRFQTEDGFMRTETVLEEYTASEDENDENKKKNSPPKPVEKKTSAEKEKKKAPQKSTQASKITSFFTKK